MDAQTRPAALDSNLDTVAAVRLRPSAFTQTALTQYGYGSATAMAKAIGVSSSTLRRAIAGEIAPGERLIAAILATELGPFEHFFTVTK